MAARADRRINIRYRCSQPVGAPDHRQSINIMTLGDLPWRAFG